MKKFTFILIAGLIFNAAGLFAQWNSKAPIIGARDGAVSWVINGKFYVAGGVGKSDLREYDPATNTWKKRADIPQGVRAFGMGFTINGLGYICGGVDGMFAYQSTLLEYDPVNNQWASRATYPGGPMANGLSFSLGNKGYVGCGDDGNFLNANLYEYDGLNDHWTPKNQFDGAYRTFPYSFTIGNRVFVGGGEGTGQVEFNDLWEYDQANDNWNPRTSMPGPVRQAAVSFASASKGFVGLGQTDYNSTFKDFFQYDPLSDSWDTVPTFNHPGRAWATGFATDSSIYVCAGWNFTTFYSDLYAFRYVEPAVNTTAIKKNNIDGINTVIFPNPTKDDLSVSVNPLSKITYFEIYNSLGELVKKENVTELKFQILLKDFPEGVYLIRMSNENGGLLDSRFVKD